MYFSRIRLRQDADPRRLIGRNGYREHQALWNLFGSDPGAKRDFLFRRDEHAQLPVYYLVSGRMPSDRVRLWQIETKDYAPCLRAGQTLAFSLRVNPVVTRTSDNGKSRRDDLVMDLKKKSGWQDLPPSTRAPLAQLVQQAGEQWLANRQERLGATVESLSAEAYQQHRGYKRGQENPIRYSTLDLQGSLTIVDEERFRRALFAGIGPAKAFGCGLLLVRYP